MTMKNVMYRKWYQYSILYQCRNDINEAMCNEMKAAKKMKESEILINDVISKRNIQ